MKNISTQNIIVAIAVTVLVLGSIAYAANPLTSPTAAAPAAGIAAPVHTGDSQVKDGALGAGKFYVKLNAQLAQDSYFNDIIRGGSPDDTNSTVMIGGSDAEGTHTIPVSVTSNVSVTGSITNDAVKSAYLCAAADGTITSCN